MPALTPRSSRLAAVAVSIGCGLLAAACGGTQGNATAGAPSTAAAATTAAGSSPTSGAATPASAPAATTVATTAAAATTVAPTVAAATTVATPPAPSASTRTSCKGVVHIGDSTSVGLISPAYLKDPAQRIDAQYGRVGVTERHMEISGARSILETMPNQINAYETARNLKAAGYNGCWVFALGTTDTANVAVGSRTTRAARIDRMMSVVGDDPVLWVDVKSLVTSGAWSNANMQLWNAALAEAQARYPNLKIYDWASVVQDEWFSSDRIHYTSAGYAQRARLIADALAATYPA